jgi:hypothetical protein
MGYGMDLSGHLCGAYVRELMAGVGGFITSKHDLDYTYWHMFSRIQINYHGEPHKSLPGMVELLKFWKNKEYIFQCDNVNTDLLMEAHNAGVNCSALFDLSHGTGSLPSEWPMPLEGIKCGYAGGLGPDNLEEQIKLINENTKGRKIWIDMETKVRSNSDQLFDLDKVKECLRIAEQYVNKEN